MGFPVPGLRPHAQNYQTKTTRKSPENESSGMLRQPGDSFSMNFPVVLAFNLLFLKIDVFLVKSPKTTETHMCRNGFPGCCSSATLQQMHLRGSTFLGFLQFSLSARLFQSWFRAKLGLDLEGSQN